MKTRVCLKYFVNYCGSKSVYPSGLYLSVQSHDNKNSVSAGLKSELYLLRISEIGKFHTVHLIFGG